jgi:hypothetical protein
MAVAAHGKTEKQYEIAAQKFCPPCGGGVCRRAGMMKMKKHGDTYKRILRIPVLIYGRSGRRKHIKDKSVCGRRLFSGIFP